MLGDTQSIGGGTADDMYVCIFLCMTITCNSIDQHQPGKVTKPARGQLNRENEVSLRQMHPPWLVHTSMYNCLQCLLFDMGTCTFMDD